MVASIDGATAIEGRSGGLGSATDTEILLGLRAQADVVLVGATTVRAERYGVPRKAGLRIGVVTTSGDGLDFSVPLFAGGHGFLITTEQAPELPVDTIRAGTDRVDFAAALAQLDVSIVHAEGGPKLNGSLLEAGLVDEVNLTLSPALVGGASPRITDGASGKLRAMRLTQVMEDEGFLFCRYVRA